jgi:glycosyltransferase involved in cell wall biosynthesis
MDSPYISLNMIVRDSAATLERAILSVKNFVDEIIVVDTGSTDNTVDIAKELGAQVYFFKWIDDFSAARNYALEKSTGEWIFWLDDDEWIDENNLKKLCAQTLSKNSIYRMRKIIYQKQKFYEHRTESLHLFPNRPDIRWNLRVHESIIASATKAGLTEHLIDVEIHNDGSLLEHAEKSLYYKRLLEQDLKNDPQNPYILYHLGMECRSLKLPEEALKYYSDALLHFPDESLGYFARVIPAYANLLIEQGQLDAAANVIQAGLEAFPYNPKLIDLQATIEMFMGSLERAEALWKELIELSYSPLLENEAYHPIGVRLAALERLEKLYSALGRLKESQDCRNKASALRKNVD